MEVLLADNPTSAVAVSVAPIAPIVREVDHKALARRFVEELWNNGNLAVAEEIIAPDCVPHALHHTQLDFGDRVGGTGPKHIQLIVAGWRAAFPDWHITITDLLADGDKVVLTSVGRGTHRGRLMGIKPTGKSVTFHGVRVLRFAGGKVVEYWVMWDWQGLWQQLGKTP